MSDIAELIDATLNKIHPCTCNEAYSGRRLVDPDCVWHEIQGDGELILDALREQGYVVQDLELETVEPPVGEQP